MNVLFTNICNLKCQYCFAKGKIQDTKSAGEDHYVTLENINKVINFAKKSNENTLGILGAS